VADPQLLAVRQEGKRARPSHADFSTALGLDEVDRADFKKMALLDTILLAHDLMGYDSSSFWPSRTTISSSASRILQRGDKKRK
jgi:hypothetical protein